MVVIFTFPENIFLTMYLCSKVPKIKIVILLDCSMEAKLNGLYNCTKTFMIYFEAQGCPVIYKVKKYLQCQYV